MEPDNGQSLFEAAGATPKPAVKPLLIRPNGRDNTKEAVAEAVSRQQETLREEAG